MDAQSAKTSASISRSRRIRRILILLPVAFVILLVLFHLVENWRGKRAWEKYRDEVKKAGGRLELADFEPASIPDEQNFAMTPLLQPLFSMPPDEESQDYQRAVNIGVQGSFWSGEAPGKMGNWRRGEKMDLAVWQAYYRTDTNTHWPSPASSRPGADILKALGRFDTEISEMRQALKRPQAHFPMRFSDPANPGSWRANYLVVLRNVVIVLRSRALAALNEGDIEAAAADIEMLLQMLHVLREDRLLLGHVVRISLADFALQPIWEGLQDHRWNAVHLQRWRDLIQPLDLVGDFKPSLEKDRAFAIYTIELLAKNPVSFLNYVEMMGDPGIGDVTSVLPSKNSIVGTFVLSHGVPRGWWLFEQASYCRFLDQFLINVLPDNRTDLKLAAIKDGEARMIKWLADRTSSGAVLRHHLFAHLFLPYIRGIAERTFAGQARFHLADTALALELHYLAEGFYPALLPDLGPRQNVQTGLDVIDGQSLRYRRVAPDAYELWSIGWDEKDDDGMIVVETIEELETVVTKEGDWVWAVKTPLKKTSRPLLAP